ncbi:MAG TPA: hypothetical protein VIA62_07610 [Thermoanaerobaculia bacterium]|nr:hypothetical protein [Thermoanaerobaculia bacterium]
METKDVVHRLHRRRRRPRFRTPQPWIVLAFLILTTLVFLRRVSPPPGSPPQLPAPLLKPEPSLQISPGASPVPVGPAEHGCPRGCAQPPPGCAIKGNISQRTGEKIYHLPGQRWYDRTVISPEKGEAWFCTEAEAQQNGWRKAKV